MPRKRLNKEKQEFLGLEFKPKLPEGRWPHRIISEAQLQALDEKFGTLGGSTSESIEVTNTNDTLANDYKQEPFVLSAYCKEQNRILSVQEYCDKYNLPSEDITSFKFLPHHYKHPTYHIVFKEQIVSDLQKIDLAPILERIITDVAPVPNLIESNYTHDALTYTDLHIGMDTNKHGNAMYASPWDKDEVLKLVDLMVAKMLDKKKSNMLVVDDLGDLMDGYNALTTRGGHELPQNMTNEQAYECGLMFKIRLADMLQAHWHEIIFNNVCNDNHSGSFGYMVNHGFKEYIELKYNHLKVVNHRTFISHYMVGDVCFLISHGKDDKTLKFGFKPHLDPKQIEKIDQYIKQNDLYKQCKRIIFKKGDSHQALFDMCGSDDFDYYNYPAGSPSSQWVQNNFKKGRKGFIIENFSGIENEITPIFY
jgi:hypothetical protein